jgi:hypothetical protein
MKKLLIPALLLLIGFGSAALPGNAGDEPKDLPKEKAEKQSFGDRDDAVLQNKRYLKIRNETDATLTVYLQFRTPENGAWTWVPDDPSKSTDALSFEIEAGKELDVQHKDAPMAGSRVRIWASSPTQKWLQYKTKDLWLVPERTEDGEHVYMASGVETFTFNLSNSKDKGVVPGDSDMPGEQNLPTEGEMLPPLPPVIPWDEVPDPLPPDFPLVRDLAVLPISTTGVNATVRVKNLGHFSLNVGRRLMVQKVAPGSVPEDKGPIGPLYHDSVKTIYLVGMAPGNYVAFINPSDAPPLHFNDKKSFTITAAAFVDAAVLTPTFVGGKVWIKVKNVGTTDVAGTQHLRVEKLPGGVPVDHGAIGPLAVNGIKAFPGIVLPAGNYRAYLTPGDSPPHHLNDGKVFAVAASFHDLDVLPVVVAAGKATIKIKSIGTADAPAGAHLKIQKLPGGPVVDKGPIGALAVGSIKTFAMIPLAPGNYKAFISPGDAPPHHGNDVEVFNVAPLADLEAVTIAKMGGQVKATIHNNGPGNYAGGTRHWHLEKFVMGSWNAIPTAGSHVIPALAPGANHVVHGTFTGNGTYRIRITPGDSQAANDTKSKVLP